MLYRLLLIGPEPITGNIYLGMLENYDNPQLGGFKPHVILQKEVPFRTGIY